MATETGFTTTRTRAATALDPDQIRKRATQRLNDRMDFANARHKPISLLKQEAKRILEQLYDAEAATFGRAERDKLTEEIFSELLGYGPLEELFRDEKIVEFMILSHDQFISRDRDFWLPMNIRFRDREHYFGMLEKIRSQGEVVFASEASSQASPAAFDVKLPNGFRVVGVCPPKVLELPATVVFTRGPTKPVATATVPKRPAGESTVLRAAQPPSAPVQTPAPRTNVDKNAQSKIDFNATVPASGSTSGSSTIRIVDPFERYRIRITERLILGLSNAGVYDLSGLPLSELRKAIGMYVREFNEEEKLGLTSNDADRLTTDILNSMNRKS